MQPGQRDPTGVPDPSNAESSFGRRFLQKQGWKEGAILGVRGEGLCEPLSVNTNSGTSGIGASKLKAEEWTHWWIDAYNEKLSNLSSSCSILQDSEDSVSDDDEKTGTDDPRSYSEVLDYSGAELLALMST